MEKNTVVELVSREPIADPLTEMLRAGAWQLIKKAAERELHELLEEHGERRTDNGKASVVRSGYLPARALQTGVCPVTVRPQGSCHHRRVSDLSFGTANA
jgi:hypothetical protein